MAVSGPKSKNQGPRSDGARVLESPGVTRELSVTTRVQKLAFDR